MCFTLRNFKYFVDVSIGICILESGLKIFLEDRVLPKTQLELDQSLCLISHSNIYQNKIKAARSVVPPLFLNLSLYFSSFPVILICIIIPLEENILILHFYEHGIALILYIHLKILRDKILI